MEFEMQLVTIEHWNKFVHGMNEKENKYRHYTLIYEMLTFGLIS